MLESNKPGFDTDRFRGTGVAIVTPFDEHKQVDYTALGNIIEYVIEGGLEYIVSLGTTGESATLNKLEKHKILDFTIEKAAGRVPIVAGFGGNNTEAVIDDIGDYHFEGIDAILSVSPYYNKPTQEGIYQHYCAIDRAAPRPIIVYNVPGRTSSNITADTTLRIARDCEGIFAVKEASGDLQQCMQLVRDKPEGFLVLSGDDALTLPQLSIGMDGVISVIANGWPGPFSEMVRLGLKGDFESARPLHYKLLKIIDLLFREGNPGGIKCALSLKGLCEEHLRQPCWPVSEELRADLRQYV